jgi:hypothetical protein
VVRQPLVRQTRRAGLWFLPVAPAWSGDHAGLPRRAGRRLQSLDPEGHLQDESIATQLHKLRAEAVRAGRQFQADGMCDYARRCPRCAGRYPLILRAAGRQARCRVPVNLARSRSNDVHGHEKVALAQLS